MIKAVLTNETLKYVAEIEKNKFKLNFDYDEIYISITLKNVNENEPQYYIWKGDKVLCRLL